MFVRRAKGLLLVIFGLISCYIFGQGEPSTQAHPNKQAFNADEVIFGHVLDAHEFHFFSFTDGQGRDHEAVIPLPVILYSPHRGFSMFSSSRFHNGEENYKGYSLITEGRMEKLDAKKYHAGQIVAVNADGELDGEPVYDLSITRNVVQMVIALSLLVWLMVSIGSRYRKGEGVSSPPKGAQSLVEPVITFIREEVAKPNLGRRYEKYLPYLLTVFFFILINNLVGLIPGTANVTGNIAFTMVLAAISFVVILFSSNGHYWKHIIWPPVPHGIKPILIPVEILGIFTKPFALMIRLFANMIAGHIIIICLVSLIFIFGALNTAIGWGFSPLSVGFVIFIYFIELLVAFLQAYIFTTLTAVFIGQAFEGGHDHHEEDAVIV